MLRWGLPRDPAAVRNLVAFSVAAVATILLTRGGLALTGYPQVSGGGLHIAHVLWGGLLLVAAMVLTLSFAGPVVRPVAAVVGGIGFGLFIDEVGKFVTDDNDYFYRPAVAIMYVVVVLFLLAAHALHGRRAHHPVEYLAAAVDQAVAGAAGGFTPASRQAARDQLVLAGDVPGAAETEALVAAIRDDSEELPDPVRHVGRMWTAGYRRVTTVPSVTTAAVVLVVVDAIVTLLVVLTPLDLPGAANIGGETGQVATVIAGSSAVVSAGLVLFGLSRLRTDRLGAFDRFHRALLVSILVTQVFQFAVDQFAALVGVGVDLFLLAVVGAERERLERLHHRQAGDRSQATRPAGRRPGVGAA